MTAQGKTPVSAALAICRPVYHGARRGRQKCP
jgi:hypothetical protein